MLVRRVCFISVFLSFFFFFFFNDTATTEIYTLSLHDALPICWLLYPVFLDLTHCNRDMKWRKLPVRESYKSKVISVTSKQSHLQSWEKSPLSKFKPSLQSQAIGLTCKCQWLKSQVKSSLYWWKLLRLKSSVESLILSSQVMATTSEKWPQVVNLATRVQLESS